MTLYSFVGVAVTSACLVIPGYSRFRNEEMLNPASLACKLAAATDPLSAHLAAAVTENTRELIGKAAAAPTDAPAPDGLAPALAALLNERIADPSLYEPGRFAGVALDPALRADLAAPPADAEGKLRLNRRLLEAAYPGDVVQQNLWDPVTVCGRFENPIVVAFAILALWIATLTTNLAANVVSPANDISNLAPRLISFRTGGMITGVVGILMMPWKLLASTQGYIFTWLIGYGALLGPIGGILIADYFVLRSKRLRLADLYRKGGTYWYQGGFNERAILALLLGVLPNIPGFLAAAFPGWVTTANGKCLIPGFFVSTYQYAWFVGFAISFVSYILLMAEGALAGPAEPSEQPAGAAGKTTAAAPDSAGPSEVPGPAAASSPSAPRPGGAGQSGSGAIEFGG
ncbi:MAG: cytosine permease [Planctomycetes bacterium]|nr:cytosine permease [Planctomycetota bacterium]